MRIVGGSARGRRLVTPAGRDTRPTSDRAREGLFSTLESIAGSLAGLRVADLYAGSGAVGIEALSRGAAYALLVDHDARAVRAVRQNAALVDAGRADVRLATVEAVLTGRPDLPFDVVFVDPPYSVPVDRVLELLRTNGWAAPHTVVVVERLSRSDWAWPDRWEALRARRYGEGTLWYGRPASTGEEG